ncbi:amidohydrolase [Sedimentibacter sp. B4]|uniref:amidohydrolase n=1 Tax=Sedimentibacter sp. B4 TaxID=304766 RepID=UPI0002D969EC|nr:amidohydrolase [Sedimentibacter sp. B4]
MKTLFTNAVIVTMNDSFDVFNKGYLLVEDGIIKAVGPMEQCIDDKANMEVVDAEGGIMIPGFVNTHTHIGMIPFRGLGEDMKDRLNRFLFPLEQKRMTSSLAKASAKYAVAEMQLSGITTLFDMYYFEDDIAEAVKEMGERAVLAETIIENTIDSKEPYGGLMYAEKFIEKWAGKNNLITPAIAPHAPYSNTKESLVNSKIIADKYNVPYMIHLAEMDYEVALLKDKYNMTPVEYLERIGFLSSNLVAAHCIFMNERDAEIMARYGVNVSHCVVANTKSGKGISPVKLMQEKGVCVGLGTDGPISGNTLDMFTVMKAVALAQKTFLHDRSAYTSREILKMATIDGAKCLGIHKYTGSLEVGKRADVTIVETESINMYPMHDPYAALVYQANAGNVHTVYVDGVKRVHNKKLCSYSVKKLRCELEQTSIEFNDAVSKM